MPGPGTHKIPLQSEGSGSNIPVSRIVIIGVVAFVLQVVVSPNIAIAGISPNFMLIALIPVTALASQRASTLAGFVYGLLFDLVGAGPVGAMALVMALAGYLLPMLLSNIRIDGIAPWMVISAVVYIVSNLVLCIVLSILGYEEAFFASIVLKVIPWAIYDLVLSAILWPVVRRLIGVASSRQMESRLQVK